MLKTLKDLWAALHPLPTVDPDSAHELHRLQLATAVMLVEVMRADAELGASERRAVIDALRASFDLAEDELARLLELAEQAAAQAIDLFSFTSRINDHFDMPAKIAMVEQMWSVAYADGVLSAHERHVLWRVADLLHVPQGAYHHARQRAQEAAATNAATKAGDDPR